MLLITSTARRHRRCGEMKWQPVIVRFPDGSRVNSLIEHRRCGSDCSLSPSVGCGGYCTPLRVGFSFNLLRKSAPECTDVPLCACTFTCYFHPRLSNERIKLRRLNRRRAFNVSASPELLADVRQLRLCLWLCSSFHSHIFVNSV